MRALRITLLGAVLALPAATLAQSPVAQPPMARDVISGCVPCHGDAGVARDAEVPHLAGQNEVYLFNQMMAFKSGKRKHAEMRFMTRELNAAEIAAIAAYYAVLPPR